MKKGKNNKGITLISLVITIIVLLILAAVSIGMLLGENGILTRANEAAEATSYGTGEEKVKLAVLGSYDNTGKMSDKLIVEELYKLENQGMTSLTDKDGTDIAKGTLDLTNKYPIKAVVDGYEFEIEKTGKVTGDKTHTGDTGNSGNNGSTEGLKPGETAGTGGEEYTDTDNKTAFVPEGGSISGDPTEDTIAEGLVMTLDNNEFVWVEVPRDIFTTATSGTDYEEILNDIVTYTTVPYNYRAATGNYGEPAADISQSEVWYDGNGLTEEEYTTLKQNILSGIFEKNGFWVGRYEVGDESNTPVIQNNKAPYVSVTVSEAQDKAESIYGTGYNGTLMLGVQWDLILKFMEINGITTSGVDITYSTLCTDSTDIGNYESSKANTGVTAKAEVLNIYDIAGNVWEWTLEKSSYSSHPCIDRGGYYHFSGSIYPAAGRLNLYSTSDSDIYIGFRVALY